MTDELKTLKDFGIIDPYDSGYVEDNPISITELKAEAVKWVKEMERENREELAVEDWHRTDKWINFFNLTEEDLK